MTRTHPPLFNALTRRLSPRHPVNVLARRIAHREDTPATTTTRRYPPYYPPNYSDPHERDCT